MRKPRIKPDRAALEIVYGNLKTSTPLDQMLANKTQRALLESLARKHIKQRDRYDFKKQQANDND